MPVGAALAVGTGNSAIVEGKQRSSRCSSLGRLRNDFELAGGWLIVEPFTCRIREANSLIASLLGTTAHTNVG
jgi:hypothetical protein